MAAAKCAEERRRYPDYVSKLTPEIIASVKSEVQRLPDQCAIELGRRIQVSEQSTRALLTQMEKKGWVSHGKKEHVPHLDIYAFRWKWIGG